MNMGSGQRVTIFFLQLSFVVAMINDQYSFEKKFRIGHNNSVNENHNLKEISEDNKATGGSFSDRIGYRSENEAQFSGYGNEQVSSYDSDGDKKDVVAIAASSVALGIGALGLAWYIQDLYNRVNENDDIIVSCNNVLSQLENDFDDYRTNEAKICEALTDVTKIQYTTPTDPTQQDKQQYKYLQDLTSISINC